VRRRPRPCEYDSYDAHDADESHEPDRFYDADQSDDHDSYDPDESHDHDAFYDDYDLYESGGANEFHESGDSERYRVMRW
jgi:hypothetical protein